jgi:hypothetical protein
MTTAAIDKMSPIIVEICNTTSQDFPANETEMRAVVRKVLKDWSEEEIQSSFSPAVVGYLALARTFTSRKRAVPPPPDHVEVDIAEDEPEPVQETVDLDEELIDFNIEVSNHTGSRSIKEILSLYDEGRLVVPEIQRNSVWKAEKQALFISSVYSKMKIDELTFCIEPGKEEKLNLLDGLQRVSALLAFRADKIALGDKYYSQLSENMQAKFLFRPLEVTEATTERKNWPAIFERKNQGGLPLNIHEIRRATYVEYPWIKMLDLVTRAETVKGETSPVGKTFVELFGGNNRFVGMGAVMRALALVEFGHEYRKPMKVFLNTYCAAHVNTKAKEANAMKAKLGLIFEALKEKLGTQAFRMDGSRANNLGLVDAMIYGGLLFQEHGVNDVEALGDALAELRGRLTKSKIIHANLKDDTSSNDSVIQRMDAVQKRCLNILNKQEG